MDASFWHKCWERNSLGFHQESVHPFLQTYLAPQLTASDQHVFVPLCGKSLDMVWLAENMKVTGAELSEIACRDFFEEKGISGELFIGEWKGFDYNKTQLFDKCYGRSDFILHIDADDLIVGDFKFQLSAATLLINTGKLTHNESLIKNYLTMGK